MSIPTVGGIVHYKPAEKDDEDQAFMAAIVTGRTILDSVPKLCMTVFPPIRGPFCAALPIDENVVDRQGRSWCWPAREGR